MLSDEGFEVVDSPVFLRDRVLPRLGEDLGQVWESAMLHPTCSTTHLGSGEAVKTVAGAVVGTVDTPDDWGCCAFAGDRGMLHPELTASATQAEAQAVDAGDYSLHVSTNRTCEIGMTRATGRQYVGLISALAQAAEETSERD